MNNGRRARFLAVLGVVTLLAPVLPTAVADSDGTPRPSILIVGNAGLGVGCVPNVANGVVSGCGTSESPYVIEEWRIDGAVIPDARTELTLGAGIEIRDTTSFLTIRRNHISHHYRDELILRNVQNVVVAGNVIGPTGSFTNTDLKADLVLLEAVQNVELSDNELECGSSGFGISHGIWLFSGGGVNVSGNNITGCQEGMRLQASGGTVVTGNNVTGGQLGIFVCAANYLVSRNMVTSTTQNGVGVGFCSSNVTITHNLVTNNSGVGIYISAPAKITDNILSYNSGGGLSMDSGIAGFAYSGNDIFGNTGFGATTCTIPTMDLRNNWWGSSSGPSGNGSGSGDAITDCGLGSAPTFSPWLSSPNPSAGP